MAQLTLREFIPGAAPAFALSNARVEAKREYISEIHKIRHDSLLRHRSRLVLRFARLFPGLSITDLHSYMREYDPVGVPMLRRSLLEMEMHGLVRLEVRSLGRKGRRTYVFPISEADGE